MAKYALHPFQLSVPESVLDDLRQRLLSVRLPDEPPLEPWSTGTSVAYLKQLLEHWRDGFDWRAQEAQVNAFRQFTVPLAGIDLHFIHEVGRGPNPMPLLLCHGWPGSVMEFQKLLPVLRRGWWRNSEPGPIVMGTPKMLSLRMRCLLASRCIG